MLTSEIHRASTRADGEDLLGKRRFVIRGFSKISLLIISILLLGSNNIFNLFANSAIYQRELSEGGLGSAYQYIAIGVSAILLLVPTHNVACKKPDTSINTLVCALIVWCFITGLWSPDPFATLRRAGLLGVSAAILLSALRRVGPRQGVQITFIASIIVLILGYIAVGVGTGVHTGADLDGGLAGNWRGVHPHKNAAGPFCASLMILSFWRFVERPRWHFALVHILSVLFLWMTSSKSSILLAFPAAYGVFLISPLFTFPRVLTISIVCSGLFGLVFTTWSILIIDETTFTGRGKIWIELWPLVMEHFWFGIGYGSVWNVGHRSPVFDVVGPFVGSLSEAHNGYIDIMLSIGVFGLFAFLLTFYIIPFFCCLDKRACCRNLCISLLIFTAAHAFFESSFLATDTANWDYILLVFYLCRSRIPRAETDESMQIRGVRRADNRIGKFSLSDRKSG